MASTVKKTGHKLLPHHPLDRKFNTVEEAAQAKTDYVWNTLLKDVDWNQFDQMRANNSKSE